VRSALLAALLATLIGVSVQTVRVRAAALDSSVADSDLLAQHKLLIPVEGIPRSQLRDNFDEGRPGHKHEALDILAPRGTPVIAAGDGKIVKLFRSVAGGITLYQFDSDERFAYYYAHLDRYAEGVRENMPVKRGDLIGYVGTTGNAPKNTPHLHFTIFRLGPDKRWWKGTAVNPYPFLAEFRR